MSAVPTTQPLGARRRVGDRLGDPALRALTGAAAVFIALLLGGIAWKVFDVAWPAISKFGLGFLVHQGWDVNRNVFSALDLIYGTAITSFVALAIAAPISIAIALFLTELAPSGVRWLVTSLTELLAAVPSVIVGFWGILVLGPFLAKHLEPWLHRWFGFIPIFSGSPQQSGILIAIAVLTIMIVPICTSICRELFLNVPQEQRDGALALGATRWEMIRGVVFPYTRSGIGAAMMLGLGRAVGEAIAVTQVIGAGYGGVHWSWFATGDTLASRIAAQYQGAANNLQIASLVYLAAILLVITLVVNGTALWIVRRFAYERLGAD